MELKISKILLDLAIERIGRAIDPNPYIPALKGVLIYAENNQITFTGSNGKINIKHTIEASLDAEIISAGVVLVDYVFLRNIVKRLEGDVLLKSDDTKLSISTENDNFHLNLFASHEYPLIDFNIYGEKLKVNWLAFKNMAKDVMFAASTNEAKLILCCVNISSQNRKLKMIATDSFRYSEQTIDVEENSEFNISLLAKNLRDLLSFEYNGDVILNISEHKILFELDGTVIECAVFNQAYNDVSRIFPKQFAHTINISKRVLNSLLNKVLVIVSESYNKIRLNIGHEFFEISSVREEIADAAIRTSEFSLEGEEFKVALNSKYLREAIAVYDDEITLKFTADRTKILLTSDTKPNAIQLISAFKGF
ncbi:DNA polymerase III subunit beta [Mycoplasma struthionis]|uniref:DNA polymerase III subunit beta n=1 Tax=Mycoplasma struthionis TaxID=538220 RepID=A0A502M7R0_9MOLU|nr:DNA polymerase III subunit beta [Mycoplasma struthionis]TPI02294.1 DNA polymerase III subunit beta [Mycoplasma struthionis]